MKLLTTPMHYLTSPVEKRVGLILLATDNITELDFRRAMPQDRVGVYCNRVRYANPTTADNLRAMLPHIEDAGELILPDQHLDVLYYSCTSASVTLGEDEVCKLLRRAKPDALPITPTIAATKALNALGAHKISLLTPYLPETSVPIQRYFEAKHFDVISHACMGLGDDRDMARLSAESIVEAAVETCDPASDALFISCTALPARQTVTTIEEKIGKPVVTSNQAAVWLAWHHLHLPLPTGIKDRLFAVKPGREESEP